MKINLDVMGYSSTECIQKVEWCQLDKYCYQLRMENRKARW